MKNIRNYLFIVLIAFALILPLKANADCGIEPNKKIYKVTSNASTYIYDEESESYKKKGELKSGTIGYVIEYDYDGQDEDDEEDSDTIDGVEVVELEVEENYYYVLKSNLKLVDPTVKKGNFKKYKEGYIIQDLQLRSGPAKSYPVVTTLKAGTTVEMGKYIVESAKTIEESITIGSYVLVSYGDKYGWLFYPKCGKGVDDDLKNISFVEKFDNPRTVKIFDWSKLENINYKGQTLEMQDLTANYYYRYHGDEYLYYFTTKDGSFFIDSIVVGEKMDITLFYKGKKATIYDKYTGKKGYKSIKNVSVDLWKIYSAYCSSGNIYSNSVCVINFNSNSSYWIFGQEMNNSNENFVGYDYNYYSFFRTDANKKVKIELKKEFNYYYTTNIDEDTKSIGKLKADTYEVFYYIGNDGSIYFFVPNYGIVSLTDNKTFSIVKDSNSNMEEDLETKVEEKEEIAEPNNDPEEIPKKDVNKKKKMQTLYILGVVAVIDIILIFVVLISGKKQTKKENK